MGLPKIRIRSPDTSYSIYVRVTVGAGMGGRNVQGLGFRL